MAYGRYEARGQWREPRARRDENFDNRGYGRRSEWRGRDDDSDERGFFERAGDEVASWFGDEDAARRRRHDERRDDELGYGSSSYGLRSRQPRAYGSDADFGRPRGFDDDDRRPYTGRGSYTPSGLRADPSDRYATDRSYGEARWDRGRTQREMGSAGGLHDRDYSRWRQGQIDALDQDYDAFRRENSERFEREFSTWRSERQTKRQLLNQLTEHMPVVGSDNNEIGKVDKVRGDRVILTKDSSDDGRHHSLSCASLDRVEDGRVYLNCDADQARQQWRDDDRSRALYEREDSGEAGPMVLENSFSGTYR